MNWHDTIISIQKSNKFNDLVKDSFINNFVEIVYDIEKDLYLEGNKNLLIQALINIYNNALDALKEYNDSEKKFFFVHVKKENSKVVIELKDNAKGIPSAYIEKIFDPYFTTKHKSKGTGISLSMTYNLIVNGMHGNIEAKNVTYKYNNNDYTGAQFTIELPLS